MKILKKLQKQIGKLYNEGLSGMIELPEMFQDKNSSIYCKGCGRILPIFRVGLKSKNVKVGEHYIYKCKCGFENKFMRQKI